MADIGQAMLASVAEDGALRGVAMVRIKTSKVHVQTGVFAVPLAVRRELSANVAARGARLRGGGVVHQGMHYSAVRSDRYATYLCSGKQGLLVARARDIYFCGHYSDRHSPARAVHAVEKLARLWREQSGLSKTVYDNEEEEEEEEDDGDILVDSDDDLVVDETEWDEGAGGNAAAAADVQRSSVWDDDDDDDDAEGAQGVIAAAPAAVAASSSQTDLYAEADDAYYSSSDGETV